MISELIVRLLTQASLRAALVLALAGAAVWTLRRASAELRHGVWKAALVAVLALPIGLLMPRWKLAVLPAAEGPARPTLAAELLEPVPAAAARLVPAARPRVAFSWPGAITLGWLAGCAFLLAREARCRRRLALLVAESFPVADPRLLCAAREAAARAGYRGRFDCLISPALRVPIACGVSRPTVLLPERAREWGAKALSDVLVHEMTHLRRRDPLWLWAARLGRVFYWFHPLVWLATRRLLAESERACDDAVMRGGERPSGYAETLLLVASPQVVEEPAPALAFVRRHALERRIAEVLAQGRNLRPLGVKGRGLLALLGAGIAASAAVAQPVARCAGDCAAPAAAAAATAPAPPAEAADAWRPGGPARRGSAHVCNENHSALRLLEASAERTAGADGREVRLARPRIAFQNRGRRVVTAVQLGLDLPTTKDRMWEEARVAPGGTGEIALTEREWAAVVPAGDASRLIVQVAALRFENGEVWRGDDQVSFPPRSHEAGWGTMDSRIDARDPWVAPLER